MLKKCAILLLMLAVNLSLMAQGRTVSGTINDSGNEPIPGVSVLVKGTTNGTITDINGKYNIEVPGNDAVLVFSFIGMKNQEVAVGSQTAINITLSSDLEELNEVVVIGYGVQKKKLNTGATAQVKGDMVQKQNTTSPLQAMQGQIPGVVISSNSGQPGTAARVSIRGLGTIGDASPLYVIDGIPGGNINTINAADIESIDVLKDAASAAIYGAQAANGVILVTTKKGQAGKGVVSFDTYYGVQNLARTAPMLDANQYKAMMDEQALNSGSSVIDWASKGELANTDWVSQMFKENATTQSYNLGVTGGSETTVYAMSLNYLDQEGIVGGSAVSNYKRYGFRFNSESKVNSFLKIGEHAYFTSVVNNGINVGNQYNNTLRGAFTTSPLAPVYSDNNLYDSPYNDTSNSLWFNGDGNPYGSMMTNSNNINNSQNVIADVYAEIEPIKNLKIRTVAGVNFHASDYRSFTPIYRFSIYAYNEDHTTVNQSMSKGRSLTWTNTAAYSFKIQDNTFDALVGMEAFGYEGVGVGASNWNLLSQFNDWNHAYIANTTGVAYNTYTYGADGKTIASVSLTETKGVSGGPDTQYRRASYFGRIGWDYKEKYLLNATVRGDGSSNFAPGNQFGYFPSVSAGWIMTQESFLSTQSNWLNYLKLRASWGQVGNNSISAFQYASPINTSTSFSSSDPAANYIFGTNLGSGANIKGAYPSRLSNPNVRWETSEQTNIGFDARLFNKMGVTFDFYNKTTKDWLVVAPILATGGAQAPYINGGDVKNTGVELGINWNDNIGDVNYSINVNGAYNKNEVGVIPTEDGIIHGQTNMLFDNSEEFYRAQNGYSIGYFWGYKTAGIFQNETEISEWIAAGNGVLQSDVKPGDVKYYDINHDGAINNSDKVDLGNGRPDFTFGLNLGVDYKGFDFSVMANAVMGNKIVQSYRNHTNKQANYTTAILDRWTGEGTSNKTPRVTETNINWQFSDLYLQDGDFLRISNITLGYDFARLMKVKAVSQCRIYASVQNAFTFTKYDGMDPEIGYGTDSWVSGVDLGYYPNPRTILLGLNVKF